MHKIVIIAVIAMLVGCANVHPYAGLSAHSESLDSPEVNLSTGLGFIGAEYTADGWGDFHLFAEHVSRLQTTEKGAGLNHIGFKLRK